MDSNTRQEARGIEHGNAFRQRHVLELLEEEAALTSQEIADGIGVTQAGIKSVLQRLQRDGNIEKRRDPLNPVSYLYEVSDDE